MSDINALMFYSQKEREFSVQGAGLSRFRQDCIDAINRGIRRINIGADLDPAITEINDINPDTYITLDSAYEHILSDVVTVELVKMGQRPQKKEFEVTYRDLVASLPDQIDMIRSKILNESQDADSDEETSFIGLNRH